MADITALGNSQQVETLDLSQYAPSRESTFQLPTKGRYTLRAPDSFPPAAFGRTKAGSLSVKVDPTIVGPTHEGLQIRYVNVSAKVFQRKGMNVSQLGDYLLACGVQGVFGDEQALADAAESTAGVVWEGIVDWKGYNSKTGFSIEGMERFPKLADGTYQTWVTDPTPGAVDENGDAYKVRANLTVSRFIPQGE